jgi:hypothetical protein
MDIYFSDQIEDVLGITIDTGGYSMDMGLVSNGKSGKSRELTYNVADEDTSAVQAVTQTEVSPDGNDGAGASIGKEEAKPGAELLTEAEVIADDQPERVEKETVSKDTANDEENAKNVAIKYSNILNEDIDIRFQPLTEGIKEEIVVNQKPRNTAFYF